MGKSNSGHVRRRRTSKTPSNPDSSKSKASEPEQSKNEAYDDDDDSKYEESQKIEESELIPPAPTRKPFSWRNMLIRTITGTVLASIFCFIFWLGPFYCILFVVAVQTELYRELVNVRYVAAKNNRVPLFRSIQWGWFFVPMFYVYGDQLHKFCTEHRHLQYLSSVTQYFPQAAFFMYCILFVSSILTLRPGRIRHQLSQYMWAIVTVCLVVFQCKFFAVHLLNGPFWFFFPVSTVIFNDVSAYFFGVSFGRKFIDYPLTPMSPNKTWEGFIGAFFATLVFSFYFSAYVSEFQTLVCPAEALYLMPPAPLADCDPHEVFKRRNIILPYIGTVFLKPIQLHGLAYGVFASLFAPFGGFYASAIKRAYKIKDFDSLIPGHGGVMDRVDCQLFMVAFTTVHYMAMIAPTKTPSVELVMSMFTRMTESDQAAFIKELANFTGAV